MNGCPHEASLYKSTEGQIVVVGIRIRCYLTCRIRYFSDRILFPYSCFLFFWKIAYILSRIESIRRFQNKNSFFKVIIDQKYYDFPRNFMIFLKFMSSKGRILIRSFLSGGSDSGGEKKIKSSFLTSGLSRKGMDIGYQFGLILFFFKTLGFIQIAKDWKLTVLAVLSLI